MNLKQIITAPNTLELLAGITDTQKAALAPELTALYKLGTKGHKDNFKHSFQVLTNGVRIAKENNIPVTAVLKAALLLHDIGKPATRAYHNGKATFWNHEYVGARIAYTMMLREGFTKQQAREARALIAYHMRSYGYSSERTDAAVRRIITDVTQSAGTNKETVDGVPTFTKLMVLFKADLTTKNKRLKERILTGLNQLEAHANRILAQDARAALRPAINGHDVMRHFGIKPGWTLGEVMRYLNTDEGINLTQEEAYAAAERILTKNGTLPAQLGNHATVGGGDRG